MISRPTQISTSVGVVQAIIVSSLFVMRLKLAVRLARRNPSSRARLHHEREASAARRVSSGGCRRLALASGHGTKSPSAGRERAAARAAAEAERAEAERKAIADAQKIVGIWNAWRAGGRALWFYPTTAPRSICERLSAKSV